MWCSFPCQIWAQGWRQRELYVGEDKERKNAEIRQKWIGGLYIFTLPARPLFLAVKEIFQKRDSSKTHWIRKWKWEFSVKSENLSFPPPHYNLTIMHWIAWWYALPHHAVPYYVMLLNNLVRVAPAQSFPFIQCRTKRAQRCLLDDVSSNQK